MEIKGPGRISTSRVSQKKKNGGAAKSGFSDALSSTEGASPAPPPSGTSPLTAVNSLLSLQEMPTSSEGRSKGIERVEDLLLNLDIIRHGLLAGQIPHGKLKNIIAAVSQERELSKDPQLDQILDDVELRVKVELAKLEMIGE